MQSTADAASSMWSSVRWRFRLSLAGLSLGLLPVGQGHWRDAMMAGLVGLLVVGAWAIGVSSRSAGLTGGAGMVAVMAGVFAISQWPRGLLAAPIEDWLGLWLLVGGAGLAGLVFDGAVRADRRSGRVRPASPASTAPLAWWIAAVLVYLTLSLMCCCGFGTVLLGGDGQFRVDASNSEVLPLPPALRLISADLCAGSGTSGACAAEFVVTSPDGAPRTTTVDRIVDHLRHLGWPLELSRAVYRGCREFGGILPWTPHCLWLYADPESEGLRPPSPPPSVTIYISN